MNKLLFLIFSFFIATNLYSQTNWYDEVEEVYDTNKFSIGVNLAAYFPNQNTAELYVGAPYSTPYGIEYILNLPAYKPTFDNYFQYPYEVAEYPLLPKYKTAFELGLHMAYRIQNRMQWFMDFNLTQLDFEQTFTIQIDDPYNGIPGPTYQQFPIIGEENRFFINLGLQYEYVKKEFSRAYVSAFGHANNVQLQQNYFVIDQVEYNIFHYNPNTSNQRPGGNSLGFGFGTGYKFAIHERLWIDLMYQCYYSEIKLNNRYAETGLQNSLGLRIIWN